MNILNNENGNGGIGLFGLMGLLFIALKLLGYITWSWWWVTAPLWGGFVLAVVLLVVAGLIALAASK